MTEQEPTDSDLERARAEAAVAEGKRACQSLLCAKYLRREDGVLVGGVFLCHDCADQAGAGPVEGP